MNDILQGMVLSVTPEALGAASLGIIVGLIVGAIPGLTATMAAALIVPYTFYFSPWVGIPMMIGMFKGSLFSGSIAAILIRTPGTPAAAATVFDGYPMAQQGKGLKAIKMSLYASVFGDTFSNLCLLFLAGLLAMVALQFGPAEYTLLIVFSLLVLGSVTGPVLWKGLLAVLFGMILGIVGLDPINGTPRLTFGRFELDDGISLIPMLIGFLAVSEVFMQMENSKEDMAQEAVKISPRKEDSTVSMKEMKESMPILWRSSVIGGVIGLIPGVSATVAAIIAYNDARRVSRQRDQFGKGALDGVTAPECANNAVSGANLVPLLAFGIPGDVMAALILSALIIQGITPGPLMFETNGPAIYAIIFNMILANGLVIVFGLIMIRFAGKLVAVPKRLLFTAILIISAAGAYADKGSLFDVQLIFVFGTIGYLLRKIGVPTIPLLVGYILMPLLERNTRITMLVLGSENNPIAYLFTRPMFLTLLAIMAGMVFFMLRKRRVIIASAEG